MALFSIPGRKICYIEFNIIYVLSGNFHCFHGYFGATWVDFQGFS